MKKLILSSLLIIAAFALQAQVTAIEYPSGLLSEEKINQLIKAAKKHGTKAPELQKHKEHLYQQLKKQNEAIANGTYGKRTIQPPVVATSGCTNAGFEDGTTNGWNLYQASNDASVTLPCPTCFTGVAGGVYEVTSPGGSSLVNTNAGNNTGGDASATCDCSNSSTNDCTPEPYTSGVDRFGGFPTIAPGGTHSLLMNNSNCGYLMQRAGQTINVDASNSFYTYQYAVVLQDGGHPLSEAPYFEVTVEDGTGTPISCMQYSVSAEGATSGNLAGWTASTVDQSVYYKPWATVNLDLTPYIGQAVTINFDVSDCNQGGHFGYAYIDAGCNTPVIAVSDSLCTGGTTILYGPPGMATYTWTGPVAGNTQNLVTGTPGSYTLATTSITSTSGCSMSSELFYYTLTQSSATSPTVSVVATNDSICAGTTATLTASGANTYTWSTSANTTSITASPTSNITYTVTGTDNTTGCSNSAMQTIYIESCTTGIDQIISSNEQVAIYPNPANGILYVSCKAKNTTLFITDLLGNKIKQVNADNDLTSIDISSLSEGVYFLNIQTAVNMLTKKFVVQR